MPSYVWVTITAMALVTTMWYSPEWFKRYNSWRQERKARREKAQWISGWLVSRSQMREDRHRPGNADYDETVAHARSVISKLDKRQ